MNAQSLVQSFALNQKNLVVCVEEVPRGLECGCFCSVCQAPLIAKQGEQRIWHFAHATESDCQGAAESLLHKAAKQLILEYKGITLPPVKAVGSATLSDGRHAQVVETYPETWIDFESVILEQAVGSIRPDVIGCAGEDRYIIEIAVSHFVEAEKGEVIRSLDWPAIEIQLDPTTQESWNWDSLAAVVIHGTEQKTWIHWPGRAELEARANAKAYETASMQALKVASSGSPASGVEPVKIDFRLHGMIVRVTDLPFGVAVWSPYNPEVNIIIKSIVKPLGGQWQPKYKNWLLPKAVRPFLILALGEHVNPKTC
jgi:hypothetical protein